MKTVEFNEDGVGKWAEDDTLLPQFEITKAGQTHLCSITLADRIVGVKKGKVVATPSEEEDPTDKKKVTAIQKAIADKENPAAKDKGKAEKNPAKKDKGKAESK